jgi:hypothetical protein
MFVAPYLLYAKYELRRIAVVMFEHASGGNSKTMKGLAKLLCPYGSKFLDKDVTREQVSAVKQLLVSITAGEYDWALWDWAKMDVDIEKVKKGTIEQFLNAKVHCFIGSNTCTLPPHPPPCLTTPRTYLSTYHPPHVPNRIPVPIPSINF